jgi:hypothetical protein
MRKAGQKAPEIAKKKKEADEAKKPLIPKDAPMRHGGKGGTKGTFTAAASRNDMGVQEFASHVKAHPEKYSPAMRKKANFAANAAKWKH